MIIIAYIILAFTLIQMLVAMANLISEIYLPEKISQSSDLVSVMIPARNEESNIGNILQDLVRQDYTNIEIIVFDDQSEDKTREIVNEFTVADTRIRLVSSEGLPEGWLGKNFACYSLSKHSKGDYLLFLDADVRIKNNTIGKALSFSKKHDLALISIFPKQIIGSTAWLGRLWDSIPTLNDKPKLIVWGMKDIAFRERELVRWERTFPDARSIRLRSVGHYVQEEAPDELVAVVIPFLKETRSA